MQKGLTVFSVMVLAFIILATTSFKDGRPSRSFISKTFTYIKGKPNQRIEKGHKGLEDPRENSIGDSTFTNETNWSETSNVNTSYGGDGSNSYVGTITIDNWQREEDDDDDNGISFSQALKAVFREYDGGSYPVKLEIDSNGNGIFVSITCSKNSQPH